MNMFSLGKAVILSTLSILVTLIRRSMMVYKTLETDVKSEILCSFRIYKQKLILETHDLSFICEDSFYQKQSP